MEDDCHNCDEDESGSIGYRNLKNEIKFVSKPIRNKHNISRVLKLSFRLLSERRVAVHRFYLLKCLLSSLSHNLCVVSSYFIQNNKFTGFV